MLTEQKLTSFLRDQTSRHLIHSPRRKISTRTAVAGNVTLLPPDVIDFALLSTQMLLAESTFIVRCHVTSK